MLDIDTKIISKVIPNWLKKINILINENQTVCLDKRFINEEGRLIYDIVNITYSLQFEGILLTVEMEKAFESVNHLFKVSDLAKYGFKNNFIGWIKLLLENQEFCIINGGQTTNYFKLEEGTRQGQPFISISLHSRLRNTLH